MIDCKNLRVIPTSICKLNSLKYLDLHGCSNIKELPTNLGKLEQLCKLNARGTSISHVPSSCGSLRYLNYLVLGPWYPSADWYISLEHSDQHLASSCSNAILCSLYILGAPYQYLQDLQLQISHGSLSLIRELNLSHSSFNTLPFSLCHLSQLQELTLNNCRTLQVIQDLPLSLRYLSAKNCPLLKMVQDLSSLLGLERLHLSNCSQLIDVPGVENLVYLQIVDIINCSALVNNPWSVNFFKAHFQNPNLGRFKMWVSKDMQDPEYMCSNEVVGCSSNCKLPLFLKRKQIFIVVMVSCLFRCVCYLEYKIRGKPPKLDQVCPLDENDMRWKCMLLYDHFTELNEDEKMEVLIEFNWVEEGAEENISVHTCIVHGEDEGGVCFFPIIPNKVIKFHPDAARRNVSKSNCTTPLRASLRDRVKHPAIEMWL